MTGKAIKLMLVIAMVATPAMAATWYKVGDTTALGSISGARDVQRIPFNALASDASGNVYAATSLDNGMETNNSQVTIFKAGGGQVNVNLSAAGYQGMITKMVKAGDGNIYALQNFQQIQWDYDTGIPSRILKITPTGTVTAAVIRPTMTAWNQPSWKITGMDVGADGNIYYTTWGNNSSTGGGNGNAKNDCIHRYNISTATAESLDPGYNNGWSQKHKMLDFVNIGNNDFAWIASGANEALSYSRENNPTKAWRRDGNIAVNPGWGRDHITGNGPVYDGVKDAIWVPARGASGRLILSRINGVNGTVTSNHWHFMADEAGGSQWITGMDTDANGDCWFGFMTDTSGLAAYQAARGHVWRYDQSLARIDEGIPQLGADIQAVQYMNGGMYALVLDGATNTYSVYTTVPEPATLAMLALGGLTLLRRRRA